MLEDFATTVGKKEGVKLSADTVIYLENPRPHAHTRTYIYTHTYTHRHAHQKKSSKTIGLYSKVAGHQISTRKPRASIHANNAIERNIKKLIPFSLPKKSRYLVI